ncbi:MAG TPA: rhodanese-like domain-containing protein [Gammaproteobacteria bacterium]|nr:rhodanese-like domain-containing protein [Gammaproteobacteria bacterium]
MRMIGLGFFACLLWLAGPVAAESLGKMEVPEAVPGVTTQDAEGLIGLVQSLPGLVLIDSRVPADRHQGYIQGSISLPDNQTACATLGDVLPDLDTPVVFYCNGVKCGRSVIAIQIARDCGYRNVHWFRGGFEEWKQKGYPFLQQ